MRYVIGILMVVGLILPYIPQRELGKLLQAAEHPARSEHPLVKVMVNKFTASYKLKIGVNNVDSFVDKYVYTYKIGGLYLSTWDRICRQPAYLLFLICFSRLLVDVLQSGGQVGELSTVGVGVGIACVLIVYNSIFERKGKLQAFGQEMKDYLENSLRVKLEQDYVYPELRQSVRREVTEPEKGITPENAELSDLNRSIAKREREKEMEQEPHVLSNEENTHAPLCMEEEIIDEILREYLG